MKDKVMKEKTQIVKVKVKSAYQMEKDRAGGNLTKKLLKKMS
jgi:hypothetical protein